LKINFEEDDRIWVTLENVPVQFSPQKIQSTLQVLFDKNVPLPSKVSENSVRFLCSDNDLLQQLTEGPLRFGGSVIKVSTTQQATLPQSANADFAKFSAENKLKIKYSQLSFNNLIGSGEFGEVWKGNRPKLIEICFQENGNSPKFA
jgi:hypothetical protein